MDECISLVHGGALLADILRDLLGDAIDKLDLDSTYVELEGADISPEVRRSRLSDSIKTRVESAYSYGFRA